MSDPAPAAALRLAPYTNAEAMRLTGRVLGVRGLPYTVQSASTYGAVHVWDPTTQTLLLFDSRETFEHWAYGTPVSAAGSSR